ncbi:MAG: insulinase family protein [Myxococcota bacterium]|nr:insulinase family protein [Myxococcota bacterium]
MSAATKAAAGRPDVLLEVSHDLPLVSLTVATRNGGMFDPPGKEGLTRLCARLMRRTGGGRDPQELDTRVDSIGASVGADVAQSVTLFQGTVIRRSLDAFVEIACDIIGRPGLAEAEFERLRREVLAELVESLDDDRGLVRRWFRRKMFEGHPYGRPLSGTATSLSAIGLDDVRERARALAASEPVFAFSGDIERAEAEALSDRVLGVFSDSKPLSDPTPEPTVAPGRRLVIVDKPERTQTQILIGGLGTQAHDPDHTALLVGNTIFGGTFTARLTDEVRSKRGWSYGAYSSLPFDRRRQAFSMWTFPKADDAAACIELELGMLRALREKGVTKKELTAAKRYLTRSHAFAIDTASKRVGLELEARLYDLPPGYHAEYTKRVAAVTLDEVNQALQARLPEKDLLIVVVGTASEIRSAIEAKIPDLGSTEVVPHDAEA